MKTSELRASELRVGNITSMGVVYLIEDDVFRVANNDGDTFKNTWAEIKPIPLTCVWLLKFGFQKFKGDNLDCFLNDFETSCNMKLLFWKGTQINNIKYLHQLQNLYYSLTGEELKQQDK
jgi:hypothetical protein